MNNGSNPQPPTSQSSYANHQAEILQQQQLKIDHHLHQPNLYFRNTNQPMCTLRFPEGTQVRAIRQDQELLVNAFLAAPGPYMNYHNLSWQPNPSSFNVNQQYVSALPKGYTAQQPQQLYEQQTHLTHQQPTSIAAVADAHHLHNVFGSTSQIGTIINSVASNNLGTTATVTTPVPLQQQNPRLSKNTLPKREKKVLTICDPETKEVLNKEEVEHHKGDGTNSNEKTTENLLENNISKNLELKGIADEAAEIQRNFTKAVAARAFEKIDLLTKDNEEITEKSNNVQNQPKTETETLTNVEKDEQNTSTLKNLTINDDVIDNVDDSTKSTTLFAKEETSTADVTQEDSLFLSKKQTIETECNGKISESDSGNGSSETESVESKVKRYENEMDKFFKNPGNTNVNSSIYGSDFLRLMRNIVKELRHVRCPKSEAELKEFGIDKAGMPLNSVNKMSKFNNSNLTFLPPFIQQSSTMNRLGGSRPSYGGRHSDNKMRTKKNMLIGRPSMDRIARNNADNYVPRKSANAWKPSRENPPPTEAVDSEKLKHDKVKKEIRGLLNKITPSTYEALAEEFCSRKLYEDAVLLPMIIDLIFDKAVEEPHFCPLYSDLCKKQVKLEPKHLNDGITFRKSIISKCQTTFLGSNSSDEEIKTCKKDLLEDALDHIKKEEIKERIEFLKSKEKRRINGIIRFIAELYRHSLLINSIINWCVVELVNRYECTSDDVYVEYAVNMIERVGETYEKKKLQQEHTGNDEEAIEKIFAYFSKIKTKLSNRVRFMIMNLEDLHKNQWVPRHGKQGPKTMEEVRIEAEQEQLENQVEREAYERKVASRESNKKSGKNNYGGRGSMDNRPEKRVNAVIAAYQSSTNTIKKDTDLKKCEDQQKLGSTRNSCWPNRQKNVNTSSMFNERRQSAALSPLSQNVASPIESKEQLPATPVVPEN